jgi:hypothetical protein
MPRRPSFPRPDTIVAELRADMARNAEQIIKWMVGVWIGGILLFIAVMTFVLNNAIPKPQPPAPVVQPQPPVIIQLPPPIWLQGPPAPQPPP